jgi:hypothetical protein
MSFPYHHHKAQKTTEPQLREFLADVKSADAVYLDFVTSSSPENLKILFEFVFKWYEEHLDYDIAIAHGLGCENKEESSKTAVQCEGANCL